MLNFRSVIDSISTVIYPTECRVCNTIVESNRYGVACKKCWDQFHLSLSNDDIELEFEAEHFYSQSCGPYENALRENILFLKVHPHIPNELRRLIIKTFESTKKLNDCDSIIPMPLHTERYEERGYNQAEKIAQVISKFCELRLDESSLARIIKTERHRAGMNATERSESLKDAFAIKAPRLIHNRTILLVDDVITTGSTAQEAARTLIEAGARKVKLFTLARTSSILRLHKVPNS